MIEQKKISFISNKTQLQGKKIPEVIIERDYCLSWFLFGLAHSSIRDKLIFKGGTALRRCYFSEYRFSEDLDFSLKEEIKLAEIIKDISFIYEWIKTESGVEFAFLRADPSSENTHTFYLSYVGPLPGAPKEVKVDVTFNEKILTPLVYKSIIRTYDEYSDFLSNAKIQVYSLEEIAIEKTCALFSIHRNEPRDLYDMYCLITEKNLNISNLFQEIKDKMKFKGLSFEKRKSEFSKKELRLKKTWITRLSKQTTALPEFDEVFRLVKRAFRQAGLVDEDYRSPGRGTSKSRR